MKRARRATGLWMAAASLVAAGAAVSSCGGNRVLVRAAGKIELDRAAPVARDAPMIATFYAKRGEGAPVGIEKTVRVGPDGSFTGTLEMPSELDDEAKVGVKLKGGAVFVIEATQELPVAQCPEGNDGRVCGFEFSIPESLSSAAQTVVDAHFGKAEAEPEQLCSYLSGIRQARGTPELKAVVDDEAAQIHALVSARTQVLLDQGAAAETKERALEIFSRAAGLTCLESGQKAEAEAKRLKAREERDLAAARAALEDKDVAKALAILDGLLEAHPKSVEGYFARGQAWVAYDQRKKAADDLEKAAKVRTDDAAVRVRVGAFYAENGDYEKALGHYEAGLKSAPTSVDAQAGIARALEGLGRLGESAFAYEKAFGLDPGQAELATEAALLHRGLGNLPQALALYEKAYKADPRSETALLGMAQTLDEMKRMEEAVARYEEGVTKQIFGVEALTRSGERLFEAKRPGTSKQALERALDLEPGHVEASVALAEVYAVEGFHEAAKKRLLLAAQKYPKDARPYRQLGLVHLSQGDGAKAAAAFKQALARAEEKKELETLLLMARMKSLEGRTQFKLYGFDTHMVEHLDQFFGNDIALREVAQRSGLREEDVRRLTLFQKTVLLGVALGGDATWLDLMPVGVDDANRKHGMAAKVRELAKKLMK